ncbi:MAG: prolyl aminopeptidase [Elusimicrobia bacterium]|nr:prolyl aminopeptidase [Elusimicrobiota bacterium]
MKLRELYPPIKPFRSGRLKVSERHEIYFEESGNPGGKPVIFLHGGPGAGTDPNCRRFFHPKNWRIVLFDQRGCGQSQPHAELRENTTWDLVDDIEKIRMKLGIEQWVVFGGSWGSTLALAYAQTHPRRCAGLILRGIFLVRRKELLWFYQKGAGEIFPDFWEEFLKPIPVHERRDMMAAYYRRLTSSNAKVRIEAAKAWALWEGSAIRLKIDPATIKKYGHNKFTEAIARIECHYFVNKGFLKKDGQLLRDAVKLRKIPGVIIHGRYDVVCPFSSAWDLHQAWPESKLVVVPDAGHSVLEPGIRHELIEATDRFSKL